MKALLSNGIAIACAALLGACGGTTGSQDCRFTLSGIVTGLPSGMELTLLYNGANPETISADGTFTLSQEVTLGSTYALSIGTQPPDYSCVLSGGAGTVTAIQQSGVAISCTQSAEPVGGTIAGLTASGLILANGSDTLAVAANATSFTMPTAVAIGSSYAVTVQTQPANLICTINDSTGPVGAGPVITVAVSCAPAYTIGGTINGLTGSGLVLANGTDTLPVAANATAFTMPTGVTAGSPYSVVVQATPTGIVCSISNGSGIVASASVTNIAVGCAPSASFTNGQAASVVIGQDDFISNTSGHSATTLDGPWGGVSLSQGIIYITDYGNSRILGYDSIPTQNGVAADFVIGQTNLNADSNGTTASTFYYPWANSVDGSSMAVADAGNNRVLLFSPVPTATGASASVVVGQTTMTAYADGCTASTLYHPGAAMAAAGKLVVADYYNNRILIWNTVPSGSGAAADIVVGQPNMTTCTANTGGISANSLSYPGDVWTDGTKLIVADSANNRVLVWNTFPNSNDQPADIVIGQPNFSASSPNQGGTPTASTLYSSYDSWSSVTSNGPQIFISDYNNNRVLIYNAFPTTNGAAADNVLGQPDFTSNAAPNPPTASSLNGVGGVSVHGHQFFLTDYGNNRVLIYDGH